MLTETQRQLHKLPIGTRITVNGGSIIYEKCRTFIWKKPHWVCPYSFIYIPESRIKSFKIVKKQPKSITYPLV